MQNSAISGESPNKRCSRESELHSSQDTIHCFQQQQSRELEKMSGQNSKSVSHARQNKDGANAARTARITIISMILENDKRGVNQALQQLNEDLQVKKTMLNIGEREFKARFLLQPQLRPYFARVLDDVSLESVEQFIRRNKRSQLNYKSRLQLCYQYILKYKQQFDCTFQTNNKFEHSQNKTEVKKEEEYHNISDCETILLPVALQPMQYQVYMNQQGFIWLF